MHALAAHPPTLFWGGRKSSGAAVETGSHIRGLGDWLAEFVVVNTQRSDKAVFGTLYVCMLVERDGGGARHDGGVGALSNGLG